MIPINIDELLNNKTIESSRIEYKSGFVPNKVLHTICAFANDIDNIGGGYIVIGVDEQNGMPILPVKGLQRSEIDDYKKKIIEICNYIEPRFLPQIEDYTIYDKSILLIYVPGGYSRPYKATKDINRDKSNKSYYIRKGSSTIEANVEEEKELYNISTTIPFDDRQCIPADLNDIDLRLVKEYLNKVDSKLIDNYFSMESIDIYKDLNLISGSKENIKPLNVAILMFSENIHKYFKHAYIEIVDIPDPKGEVINEKFFKGPIQNQLISALEYIKNYIIEKRIIKITGQSESKVLYNYPYDAIDELLSNAVYHKSYEIDEPITIRVNYDSIEIKSIPGFAKEISDIDISNKYIKGRVYRNRRIGDFFKELKLIEGRNTGFPNIYNALTKNDTEDIIFEMDPNRSYVNIIIKKQNNFVDKKYKNMLLDENRILEALKERPLSKVELSKKLGYKGITKKLTDTIDVMVNKGKVNKIYGNGRETKISISNIEFNGGQIVSTIKENQEIINKVEIQLKKNIPQNVDEKFEYINKLEKLSNEIDKLGFGQQLSDMTSEYVNKGIIEILPDNKLIFNSIYADLQRRINYRIKEVLMLIRKV